jgi:hypothetical protein
MLIRDPQTNCLTEWQVPDWPQPLRFSGCGCEVGNWFSFFAHERLGGFGNRIIDRELSTSNSTRIASAWQIKLFRTMIQIRLTDELVSPFTLIRNLEVSNLSGKCVAWLGDAVLRLVIPWEEGLVAEIEHKRITHKNSNFYHDTEEPEVALRWSDGRRLTVAWVKPPVMPPAMTPYLYVRDQPAMPRYSHRHAATPAWVVHARCLVDYPAALAFRVWRNPFIFWSRGVIGRYLVSPRKLKEFWRGGEWRPGRRWLLTGLWPLRPHEVLNMVVKIEVSC